MHAAPVNEYVCMAAILASAAAERQGRFPIRPIAAAGARAVPALGPVGPRLIFAGDCFAGYVTGRAVNKCLATGPTAGSASLAVSAPPGPLPAHQSEKPVTTVVARSSGPKCINAGDKSGCAGAGGAVSLVSVLRQRVRLAPDATVAGKNSARPLLPRSVGRRRKRHRSSSAGVPLRPSNRK